MLINNANALYNSFYNAVTMRFRWSNLLVIFSLITFACLASYNISKPGLYYDELLFVNAALGGKSNMFVTLRLGDLPVMLMPYIGALKAWIYYPVFKLFGVNAFSIRWPVVVIGALTLWVNYKFMKVAFSRSAALIFILLAAVESSCIFHTRLDWGPTTLMMLFRGLLLLFILYWINNGKPWLLFAALLVAALGLFDKLNFIWVLSATFISLLIVYPDKIIYFIRLHQKQAILLALTCFFLIVGFISYLDYTLSIHQQFGAVEWPLRLKHFVFNMLSRTVSGTSVYEFIIGNANGLKIKHLWALGFAAIAAILILATAIRSSVQWRSMIFISCFMFFTLLLMLLTKRATGPHHMACIAPFWLIPIAVLLSCAFEKNGARDIFLKSTAFAAILIVYSSSFITDINYLKGFNSPIRNPNWDTGSYEMVRLVAQYPEHQIYCVDWGIGTIIYALLYKKVNLHDTWPLFKDGFSRRYAESFQKNILSQNTLFIVRGKGKETFPQTRNNFFVMANMQGWTLQKLEEVKAEDGFPLYEIYKVTNFALNYHN